MAKRRELAGENKRKSRNKHEVTEKKFALGRVGVVCKICVAK